MKYEVERWRKYLLLLTDQWFLMIKKSLLTKKKTYVVEWILHSF